MCFDNISLLMFEPLLVQVVDVISMANGRMPTSGSMSMCHLSAPFIPRRDDAPFILASQRPGAARFRPRASPDARFATARGGRRASSSLVCQKSSY